MKNIIVITFLLTYIFFSCNSKNDEMNSLLRDKKLIENRLDSLNAKDQRYRNITGYNEMDDSLDLNKTYMQPELIDSIDYLKLEKPLLLNALKQITYSIDSLQKLQ